ncbi:MAG: alpha/beta hydrolase, partial [Candidatus Puniceispirillum sp.]
SHVPCGGTWKYIIRKDAYFAAYYARLDQARYLDRLERMVTGLFDRDTAPGADAESLLALSIPSLIVPGKDAAHATSAARYLEEVLDGSNYWDLPPEDQTEGNVPDRVLAFLQSV